MSNAIPVYTDKNSNIAVKHIEVEHFVSAFQALYYTGEIAKVYYNGSKIESLDIDGDVFENII